MNKPNTTDFGYQQVPYHDKAKKVAGVFHSVAQNYDLMNDLMSLGIHRLWKGYTVALSGLRPGQRVLDLAGGTGDLTIPFSKQVQAQGQVILADINASMLQEGRRRLVDKGILGNVEYCQVNAECLPFPENHFHCICIAFGLRNVTDKAAALRSMYRCLKPGGRLLILEFSKPADWIKPVYDTYSFSVLPRLGKLISGDADSYRYLAESIRMHPDQETLKTMITESGFEDCQYHNLTAGIVALHRAFKY